MDMSQSQTPALCPPPARCGGREGARYLLCPRPLWWCGCCRKTPGETQRQQFGTRPMPRSSPRRPGGPPSHRDPPSPSANTRRPWGDPVCSGASLTGEDTRPLRRPRASACALGSRSSGPSRPAAPMLLPRKCPSARRGHPSAGALAGGQPQHHPPLLWLAALQVRNQVPATCPTFPASQQTPQGQDFNGVPKGHLSPNWTHYSRPWARKVGSVAPEGCL